MKEEKIQRALESTATIYVLFMFCVFPLMTHDRYYDILTFRYHTYLTATAILSSITAVLLILRAVSRKKHGSTHKEFLRDTSVGALTKNGVKSPDASTPVSLFARLRTYVRTVLFPSLTVTDRCFLVLYLIIALSTAFSQYPYEALHGFWKAENGTVIGRYQGLLSWTAYLAMYFIVSHFYLPRHWHIYPIFLTISLVCLWGIVDFFLLDPFHFLELVDDKNRYIFVSSFGNINTYTAFTGMSLASAGALFIFSNRPLDTTLAYLALLITAFANVMGLSANVFLSLGITMTLLPMLCFRNARGIIRYLLMFSTILLAITVTGVIVNAGMLTAAKYQPSELINLGQKKIFSILTAITCAFALLLTIIFYKKKPSDTVSANSYHLLRCIWTAFVLTAIGAAIVLLLAVNLGHIDVPYPLSKFLVINDTWGTDRGLNWRLGFTYWRDHLSFLEKLIGHGPDTYYIIMMDNYREEIKTANYNVLDSAHNEYLEYLLTIGLFGLLSYLTMQFSTIRRIWKEIVTELNDKEKEFKENLETSKRKRFLPILMALLFGLIAYLTQAVVNIAVPILFPIMMLTVSVINQFLRTD